MPKSKQAIWGGRFKGRAAALMVEFGESISFDARLACFDVAVSRAHASMLCRGGLLTAKERTAIHRGLDAILVQIESGRFRWKAELEDIHMNIEFALTRRVPAAAKLHAGRSRNDQVVTDMRLFFRWSCAELMEALRTLLGGLIDQADKYRGLPLPGYTHLQRAQPVSAAHHLLAYVEMFHRDRKRFSAVRDNANVCPLGSGALAGTTLPIDREFLAVELGFVDRKGRPQLTRNSMDAVADRDLYIEFASACALCGTHLSRVAEDLILWSSDEFGFIVLPDAFSTGSSIMPQKKNPDSLELIRGKAARLQGNLQTLLSLVKGLPLTYNRDLQEDKPPVFDSFDQTLSCLDVLAAVVKEILFNEDNCRAAVSDPNLLATDLVDYLVERKVSFREAHQCVGRLVALAEERGVALTELDDGMVREMHKKLGSDWKSVFDATQSLKKREQTGMPGPREVRKQIARWRRLLK